MRKGRPTILGPKHSTYKRECTPCHLQGVQYNIHSHGLIRVFVNCYSVRRLRPGAQLDGAVAFFTSPRRPTFRRN